MDIIFDPKFILMNNMHLFAFFGFKCTLVGIINFKSYL